MDARNARPIPGARPTARTSCVVSAAMPRVQIARYAVTAPKGGGARMRGMLAPSLGLGLRPARCASKIVPDDFVEPDRWFSSGV